MFILSKNSDALAVACGNETTEKEQLEWVRSRLTKRVVAAQISGKPKMT